MTAKKGTTTRGYINRNPLNIRYSERNKWVGQIGHDSGGFCKFSAFIYGIRAAVLIIKKYIERGDNTIPKIISKWAPETENLTTKYIQFVMQKTRIAADTKLSIYDRSKIIAIIDAMVRVECGNLELQSSWLGAGYDLAVTTPKNKQ